MAFKITTTTSLPGGQLIIPELGERILVHPLIDYDLELEFDIDDIRLSYTIQNAIANGWIIAKDSKNNLITNLSELQTPSVSSVNGQTGTVILTSTNIAEGDNLYYTQARFDAAFSAKSINELSDVDTATAKPSIGQYLQWNGSKWIPASNPLSTTSAFYAYTESDTLSSRTSNTFGTKTILNVNLPASALYIAEFCAEVSSNNPTTDCLVEFRRGSTILNAQRINTPDSTKWHPVFGFKRLNLSGIQTFTINFASSNNGSSVSIRNARIKITRVS